METIKRYAVLVLFIFILLISSVQAANISSCSDDPTMSGDWILINDINATGSCLEVQADSVTIDCGFHTIRSDGTGTAISIFDHANINIQQCIIENFSTGIDAARSSLTVENSLIANHNVGLFIGNGSSLQTTGNSLKDNSLNLQSLNLLISAPFNWWGSNLSSVINTTISGNVVFEPFLNSDPYEDTDNDTVPSVTDNCPLNPNPDQNNSDADDFGNVCDNCIFLENPFQENNDNDTLGDSCDLDDDNDAVNDTDDNCIFLSNPGQQDQDSDGVGNVCDNCPVDFNPGQSDADLDGKGDACDANLFLLNSVFDPLTEASGLDPKFTTTDETGYYVVQFTTTISPSVITEMENLSVEVLDFVPENALIARFDPSLRSQVENLSAVRFIGILQPADRVETGLYDIELNEFLSANESLELKVLVFRNPLEVGNAIKRLGGQIIFSENDSIDIVVELDKLSNISLIPDVKYITTQPQNLFFNFKTPITTGVREDSQAQNFFGFEGDGQVIGHLDTGVDTSHPDLAGRVIPDNDYGGVADRAKCFVPNLGSGGNALIGGIIGKILGGGPLGGAIGGAIGRARGQVGSGMENLDGEDRLGHGTSTGGVAVGLGVSGSSGNGDIIKGIAPAARLFSTKVCNARGLGAFPRTLFTGRFSEKDTIRAFTNAYDNSPGARVHTNSWGSSIHVPALTQTCKALAGLGINYRPYDTAINKFVFEKQDTLPFFAASNTGRDFPDVIFFGLKIPGIGTVSANAFECSAYETSPEFGVGNLANPALAKNVLTVGGNEQDLPDCATVN